MQISTYTQIALFFIGLIIGSLVNTISNIITPQIKQNKIKAKFKHKNILLSRRAIIIITGILWGTTSAMINLPQFYTNTETILVLTFHLTLTTIFTLISIIDAKSYSIPDTLNIGGIALVLLLSIINPVISQNIQKNFQFYPYWQDTLHYTLSGIFTGFSISYTFALIGKTILKIRLRTKRSTNDINPSALGNGDILLMMFIGSITGWQGVLIIFFTSSFFAAIYGSIYRLKTGTTSSNSTFTQKIISRWRTGQDIIPFAPFLCLITQVYIYI